MTGPRERLPNLHGAVLFNRNDQRASFISEGNDLFERERHGSDPARRFEARIGLDWAIDHGCGPWPPLQAFFGSPLAYLVTW